MTVSTIVSIARTGAATIFLRATFTPEEICELTMGFYRRNYIEGLFLSSGVVENPHYTMELMLETLRLLREKYQFHGYIHVKSIPGADEALIRRTGFYADRMSCNLELPTAEGLKKLAPNKKPESDFKTSETGSVRNFTE